MKVFTIGFTKKAAWEFFGLLRGSGAGTLVDTRLRNRSQLAGFAKRDDLEFFVRELCGMSYRHELQLAPTETSLRSYQNGEAPWTEYSDHYLDLLAERKVSETLNRAEFDNAVLLCSEANPDCCHRRLAAVYLADAWGLIDIVHL